MYTYFNFLKSSDAKPFRRLLMAGLVAISARWIYCNTWYSDPIFGRVVSTNGQPVQGVAVLASWRAHNSHGQIFTLKIAEAVTDSSGNYTIKRWGPIFTPMTSPTIGSGQPELWTTKDGYIPREIYDRNDEHVIRNWNVTRNANNISITIQALPEISSPQVNNYVRTLILSAIMLDAGIDTHHCLLNEAPATLLAYHQIEKRLSFSSPPLLGREQICVKSK